MNLPDIKVFCLQGGGATSQKSQGMGWNEDVAFTLNGFDVHGVVYEVCEPRVPPGRQSDQDSGRGCMSDAE